MVKLFDKGGSRTALFNSQDILHAARGVVGFLLLFLAAFSPSFVTAQSPEPIIIPTLIPAPGDPILFELVGMGTDEETLAELRQQDITWVLVRLRPRNFAFPDSVRETLGILIDTLHSADFRILVRVESVSTPIQDLTAFLTFLANLAALQPDAIQVEDYLNDGRIAPELYVGLMRQAFNVIKHVNVETLVISGGLDMTINGDDCAEGCSADMYRGALAAAGIARYADCIGVRYDGRSLLAAIQLAQTFNPYVLDFPDKPLCITLENGSDPTTTSPQR